MSRIGKLPVKIVPNVQIELTKEKITVKGPKGELNMDIPRKIKITVENDELKVERSSEEKTVKSLHGMMRSMIENMIVGVSNGFTKQLEIQGVGYRAALQGKKLVLSLGYSHPVEYTAPEGIVITIDEEKKNILTISGIDKQKVGHVSAVIREFRKPEPYKGKGIRYVGEHIVRKAGKTAAKTAA